MEKGPIYPLILNDNDEIRIVAPASRVEKDYIYQTVNSLSQLGYSVTLGANVFAENNQFAGTDAERLADMQQAIDDPSVRAVFCARGGYGSVRLIDRLDFSRFTGSPKWLIGFSDITIFHSYLNGNLGIATVHSPMPVNVESEYFSENLDGLDTILRGQRHPVSLAPHELNCVGRGEGQLVGGNLSILYSLQSTPFALDTTDRILFIEDVGEQLYHLDRMMNNFRLSGRLAHLNGLIVGGFTDMQDKKRPFGKSAWEIIREYTSGYSYPVAFNFPAGHTRNNKPFILGGRVKLDVGEHRVSIEFV